MSNQSHPELDRIQKNTIDQYLELKQKQLDALRNKINGDDFIQEVNEINRKWESIVNEFIDKRRKIRLLILAEAPTSKDKYFYEKPGNFLKGLSDYYGIQSSTLKRTMLEKGILLLDIYQLPLASKEYTQSHEALYSEDFFAGKMEKIETLIDDKTKIVLRYKMLVKRKLHEKECMKLNHDKFLKDGKEFTPLFKQERPKQIISDQVSEYLKNS